MDRRITNLTSRQKGLITRQQITELGITRGALAHLINTNQLVRMSPRVLRLEGAPVDDHVTVMAATLDGGAFASHDTAAALWGVWGFSITPVHVTRTRGGRTRNTNLGRIHESRHLPDAHTTVLRGVPVLHGARLLFDLAADHDARRVEGALDWMWARGVVTIPSLERMLDELSTPGRTGTSLMRRLIAERVGQPPYGSNLERRMHQVTRIAGLPEFKRQADVGDDHSWLARVDFISTTHKLIIEVDSELHHASLSDKARDRERRERLQKAGFMVRVVTEKDLFGPTHLLIKKLRRWISEAPRR